MSYGINKPYVGVGPPDSSLGNDDDTYEDTIAGYRYKKFSGFWNIITRRNIQTSYITAENIPSTCVVSMGNNLLYRSNPTDLPSCIIGMTQNAYASGTLANVITEGIVIGLGGLIVNSTYFLGSNGSLTLNMPNSGQWMKAIGIAQNSTDLLLKHSVAIKIL